MSDHALVERSSPPLLAERVDIRWSKSCCHPFRHSLGMPILLYGILRHGIPRMVFLYGIAGKAFQYRRGPPHSYQATDLYTHLSTRNCVIPPSHLCQFPLVSVFPLVPSRVSQCRITLSSHGKRTWYLRTSTRYQAFSHPLVLCFHTAKHKSDILQCSAANASVNAKAMSSASTLLSP